MKIKLKFINKGTTEKVCRLSDAAKISIMAAKMADSTAMMNLPQHMCQNEISYNFPGGKKTRFPIG